MFITSKNTTTVTYIHAATITIISVGAQSTLGGHIFARKKYVWKINKMPEFYIIFARKISKIPDFLMIFARKVNISEFHMIFARKCQNFT